MGTDIKQEPATVRFYEQVMLDLTKLKPDPDNPNVMETAQKAGLHTGIDRFGFLQVIIADQWDVIVDGHNRVEDLLKRGVKQAPGYRVELQDPSERRLIRQTINQLHGKNNPDKYALELKALHDVGKMDLLASLLGQPKETFFQIMERRDLYTFGHEDADDEEKAKALLQGPPIVKRGEVWQLGPHRLMCGDCASPDDVAKLLGGEEVHQLNTDPPYGVDYGEKSQYLHDHNKSNRTIRDSIKNDVEIEDYRAFFASFLKLIPFAPHNTLYVFQAGQHLHDLRGALDDAGIQWADYLFWKKNMHVLGRKDYKLQHEIITYGWKGRHKFYGGFSTTVLEYDKPSKSPLHPTQKPVELIARLVADGTKPGDIVYDAFGGSGSALIACQQTGRRCRMMEHETKYCDVIIRRWEAETKQKAVLLGNGHGQAPKMADHQPPKPRKMKGRARA